ncbi:MAG TPA: DUF3037 domain-containing protein [Solirubrobacteraceae bacterium]
MPAPARDPFQYALLRVVPRIERGECLNAGVILFCRTRRFLQASVRLDRARLAALAPYADPVPIERHLGLLERVAAGDPAAGAVAELPMSERFHWLVAPSSTVVQASPVHTGLCADPERTLEHLHATLVA